MKTFSFWREVTTFRALWLAVRTVPFWGPFAVLAFRPGHLGVLPGPTWAWSLPLVLSVWNIGVVWVDAVKHLRWTLGDWGPVAPRGEPNTDEVDLGEISPWGLPSYVPE